MLASRSMNFSTARSYQGRVLSWAWKPMFPLCRPVDRVFLGGYRRRERPSETRGARSYGARDPSRGPRQQDRDGLEIWPHHGKRGLKGGRSRESMDGGTVGPYSQSSFR